MSEPGGHDPFNPAKRGGRTYLETLTLQPDDRAAIAACEFMVNHIAAPIQMAADLWMDPSGTSALRERVLNRCGEANQNITYQLTIMIPGLLQLERSLQPEVAALAQPMRVSYGLLERLRDIGQTVERIITASATELIEEATPAGQELTTAMNQIDAVRREFYTIIPQVDTNEAFRSYRATTPEVDRQAGSKRTRGEGV